KNIRNETIMKNDSYIIDPVRNVNLLTFTSPTIFQKIVLSHKNGKVNLLNNLINFVCLFQILIIFKSLDRYGFFSVGISKDLRKLGYIYIAVFIIENLKIGYMLLIVSEIEGYKIDITGFNANYLNNIYFG